MGDDDDQTSFSQTQHAASVSLAKIAIQAQLSDLVSEAIVPYERADTTFTTVNATRTYTLISGFQTLQEIFMEEIDEDGEVNGTRIIHYPGGESQIRADFPRYQEDVGKPIWFYFIGGNSKTIGLSPVPDGAYTWRYYYESDVSVSTESDVLPFVNTTEAETFVRMCARHFKYLKASAPVREQLFPAGVEQDPIIIGAKSTLMGLLYPLPRKERYGKHYART